MAQTITWTALTLLGACLVGCSSDEGSASLTGDYAFTPNVVEAFTPGTSQEGISIAYFGGTTPKVCAGPSGATLVDSVTLIVTTSATAPPGAGTYTIGGSGGLTATAFVSYAAEPGSPPTLNSAPAVSGSVILASTGTGTGSHDKGSFELVLNVGDAGTSALGGTFDAYTCAGDPGI